MDKWDRMICTVCEYVYKLSAGDPDKGIPPGTPFKSLPANWVCPDCGADKSKFRSHLDYGGEEE